MPCQCWKNSLYVGWDQSRLPLHPSVPLWHLSCTCPHARAIGGHGRAMGAHGACGSTIPGVPFPVCSWTHTCCAELHAASPSTQSWMEKHPNPSRFSTYKEVSVADINYPSPIKTNTYKQFLYRCRIRKTEAEQMSAPIPAAPAPGSSPCHSQPWVQALSAVHQSSLSLEIPHSRGFLVMETSSKGRNSVVKVKSIATEMWSKRELST